MDNHSKKARLFKNIIERTEVLFNFCFNDFGTFSNFVRLCYQPRDPSSLGITRMLFGILMMVDVLGERGGLHIQSRWGNPQDCHFPLFPQMKPLPIYGMKSVYVIMWLGALGTALGYKFKYSIATFCVTYWYTLLLDKSFWNNHSYLFGIVAILFSGTAADNFCSIDGLLDDSKNNRDVPFWNYFILKFQFFILYFLAGVKKSSAEWLEGYGLINLATHWVFDPFKIFLTTQQIDYLIVHWFGFVLDLTVAFWLIIGPTRPYALIFCAAFHIMNSRLFSIGMFPYVCLATLPLFCKVEWPKTILKQFCWTFPPSLPSKSCIYDATVKKRNSEHKPTELTWKQKLVGVVLVTHCGLQFFLPYSHSITKGYNNWTQGLYGYSWDMMVHSWSTALVVVKVVDNDSGAEQYLDPEAWTQNDRWNKHGDMCIQYAHCVKENFLKNNDSIPNPFTTNNVSIYIDVWCSLNRRFQQRMFDPNYDLLKANWSPFQPVEWLLPLLTEYSNFRALLNNIQKDVYSWSNYSDVLFVGDFPGFALESFLSNDLDNVTLTVLDGKVFYQMEIPQKKQTFGVPLVKGDSYTVETGIFHKVHTVDSKPSLYMYTYVNRTKEIADGE